MTDTHPDAERIREQLHLQLDPLLSRFALQVATSEPSNAGQDAAVRQAVDAVSSALPHGNRFTERVGPVYTTDQLRSLLVGTGSAPLSHEAVRLRGTTHRLVAAKTADGRWVWPAFQFRAQAGRLVVRDDVISVWSQLPHDTLSAWTLLGWLAGPRRDLDGATPLDWVRQHGVDERLAKAIGALRRRASAA